ncbi:MAG: RNA-binding S4 domain-containing protein [Lachnospiraceae bacterium]|jgi:ribosome-associated protein|nr:RNA-binding S4 domain-containing protein [Lachnospiraceae bacterium]MEE3461762.1 RNA-binding S4 domain-containing protein [Lachnospiraceae bacterium]
MEEVIIKDDYIKLGQALKLSGLVSSGLEAKEVIQGGQVKVDGQVCTQRGKKVTAGMKISFDGQEFEISERKE